MPFMLAAQAFLIGRETLAYEELVQCGKPQVIIVNTIVEDWMVSNFLSQGLGPFRPGDKPLLAKRDRHGESLSLPWRGEDGPRLILRQAGQTIGVMALQDKAPTDRD